MFRVIKGTAAAILSVSTSSAAARGQPTDFLGVDFTSIYSDEKREIDTRIVGGQSVSLFWIDPGLGRQSYLVETDAGEICEFVTVTALESAASPLDSIRLLEEMRVFVEGLYGPPTEATGPSVDMPTQFTWLENDGGAQLPPGVAEVNLALGWANGAPVAIFLKASHHRCAHISAFGLP